MVDSSSEDGDTGLTNNQSLLYRRLYLIHLHTSKAKETETARIDGYENRVLIYWSTRVLFPSCLIMIMHHSLHWLRLVAFGSTFRKKDSLILNFSAKRS